MATNSMESPITRVAIYARVSSEEQALEGQSIQAQLRALRDYASTRGWLVVEEFIDDGYSATTDKRPAFQKMISLAKKKPKMLDVILVHKWDRFARNREHAVIYKGLLRRDCDIDIQSLLEPIEDSPQGRLMEGILEVMAEFYSANLGQEVLKGMKEKARAGAALGMAPFGYAIDPTSGRLVPIPEMVPAVRWIFDQFVNYDTSQNAIARTLMEHGTEMFGPTLPPFKWSQQGIRTILRNPAYVGVLTWGMRTAKGKRRRSEDEWIRIEGAHEPMVSEETFRLAQERLDRNANAAAKRERWDDYLLRGLVTCGNCGGSMVHVRQQSHPNKEGKREVKDTLTCSRYYQLRSHDSCYFNWVAMDEMEQVVADTLRSVLSGAIDPSQFEWVFADDLATRRASLVRALQQADQRYARQKAAYEAGVTDLDELREAKTRWTEDKARIEADIADLDSKRGLAVMPQGEIAKRLRAAIKALADKKTPLEARRAALRAVVYSVSFDRRPGTMKLTLRAPSKT